MVKTIVQQKEKIHPGNMKIVQQNINETCFWKSTWTQISHDYSINIIKLECFKINSYIYYDIDLKCDSF